jgi:acetate kinase
LSFYALALNSGSSSLKFGLYRVGRELCDIVLSGVAEELGGAAGRFHAKDEAGKTVANDTGTIADQGEAVACIGRLLDQRGAAKPDAIGHRIVHGGPALRRHSVIDDAVLIQLEAAVAFAPLHAPAALAVIRYAQSHFPALSQVACFDTTFHVDMPEAARSLPLPREVRESGVERFGFHGLSCESIVHRLADNLPDRLIIAHLGNGASVTAVRAGRSVDTSMGLTPSGGVIMGTRAGDLDPGVLLYLMRERKMDAAALEDLVDHRAGLRGISGVSSDMRKLHEVASSDTNARLAIQMFCNAVAKQIAGMITVMDGVDMIVFTGGIGEHDDAVRQSICERLAWIGVALNAQRNRDSAGPIQANGSRCAVWVVESDEDGQIARHTWDLTRRASRGA